MSRTTAQFLVELSKDPYKAWAFREDPEEILAGERLTAEERQALCSGDSERILQFLGQDSIELVLIDPAPQDLPDDDEEDDLEDDIEPDDDEEPAS